MLLSRGRVATSVRLETRSGGHRRLCAGTLALATLAYDDCTMHPYGDPPEQTNRQPRRRRLRAGVLLATACLTVSSFGFLASDALPGNAAAQSRQTSDKPALLPFAQAWSGVAQYSANVKLFEQKGATIQRATYDYTFSKPSSVTLHVLSGASAGDTLVWDGGATVVAHRGSGLLSALQKKFPLHDPATSTIRGSSVDQLSFGEILNHARETPGTLASGPGGTVDGGATVALTLDPKSAAQNDGYTREVVLLSTASHLPVRIFGYVGNRLVRRIDFSNVKLQRST